MALLTSMVAFWPLNEVSGNALDAHTNAYHLTETGGTIDGDGASRDFEEGDTEYFEIASNAALQFGNTDYSGIAWIKRESTGTLHVVLAKDINTPADARDFGVQIASADDKPQFYISGGEAAATWGTGLTDTASFHMIAFGHSLAETLVWISIDNGTPVTGLCGVAPHNVSASSPFRVGGRAFASFENYFDGRIKLVGLWARDIRTDLTTLYNGGAGLSYAGMGGGGSPALYESAYSILEPQTNPLTISQW